jgi:hypothetical protein
MSIRPEMRELLELRKPTVGGMLRHKSQTQKREKEYGHLDKAKLKKARALASKAADEFDKAIEMLRSAGLPERDLDAYHALDDQLISVLGKIDKLRYLWL